MNEILNELLDSLASLVPSLTVPVKLGLIGGIAMLVLFLICFGLSYAGKIEKYTKILLAGIKKFSELKIVTEENVGVVYEELKKHPEAVVNGWSMFMDQRVGVPSDYFPARDVLSTNEYNGKRTLGKSLFFILGTVFWVIVGLIGYYFYTGYSSAPQLDGGSFAGIVMALEFLIIPIGVFLIFYLSLDIVYGKKIKRLSLAYTSFCETLDSCMAVTDKEEEDFIADNLAEINKRVEEMVAGRNDDEFIEIVSVPREIEPESGVEVGDVLREMGIDEDKPEEPVEEPVEEPAEEPAEEPKEEVIEVPEEAEAEEEETSPEDEEKIAFLESALEKEDFVRFALENEEAIQKWARGEEEPKEPMTPDFTEMTEQETYDWVETVLQICDAALHDDNVDPEDLSKMGELLDQTLAVLDDPTCVAAITDYLRMLAEKFYSIVEG